MAAVNRGVCEKCRKVVPARHVTREGRVYIVKDCPKCGTTEAMVSTDAAVWQRKREIWQYDPSKARECALNCAACGHEHGPRLLFLPITNRCNMNCPICIANIPHMGFEFHPPLEYFARVLDGLAKMSPSPTVQLFGGEPTVREEMFEIIEMARARGLKIGIVTNGLKLADEDYCKKVCESGARVLLAFDGRSPEIYARLRKHPEAYEKKLKALENLKKFSTRRHTIMCCVARRINDKYMRDLINYCHENRDFIGCLHLIPLTETWKEGEFETDVHTTIEDVERIICDAFPGEQVDFVPAGIGYHLRRAFSFFGSPRLTFGGVHPNCESATAFFGDAERYRPLAYYLRQPLQDLAAESVRRAKALDPKLEKLNPKKTWQRLRGRLIVLRAFGGLWLRALNLRRVAKGNPYLRMARFIGGLMIGKRLKDQIKKHGHVTHILEMVVLPFEEYHSIDAQRLQNCSAGFAYEDPDTGQIRTIPVCGYSLYRDELERKIAQKYGPVVARKPV